MMGQRKSFTVSFIISTIPAPKTFLIPNSFVRCLSVSATNPKTPAKDSIIDKAEKYKNMR